MLKYLLAVLLICGSLVNASAQYPGYKPMTSVDAFKKQFAVESSKLQSIASDFTQNKTLTALTETMTSTGKFWFKRSNKVRIDYLKPFSYRLIMNGDKMLVKDEQKESRINVKGNKTFQQINKIMIDCIQGTILESKDFSTKVFENAGSYLLEMTPLSKSMKAFFSTIVLTVDKADYSVKSIEMNEAGGDKTTLTFTNKVTNGRVEDTVFSF
jgi:outer membrane lipoprotein-sorting protein